MAAFPSASIGGRFLLKAGSNWNGFDGNADALTVGVSGTDTTYDFEPETFVTVTIDKFIDGAMATAATANSSAFPMNATWDATNIGSGSGSYTLSPSGSNSANAYEAVTSDMTSGASYSTYEDTSGSVVGADCTTGKPYALEGYKSGDTLAAALAAPVSPTPPNFTNLVSSKVVLVLNRICSPNATKQAVLTTLQDLLPTVDAKTAKRIQKAIDRLEKSLTPTWWNGPLALDPKDGKKVFDEEKKVVHELTKKELAGNPVADALVQVIVAVDRSLAQYAIDNAVGVNPKDIAKAYEEMVKGDAEAISKPESAIEHYKHAWEKVTK